MPDLSDQLSVADYLQTRNENLKTLAPRLGMSMDAWLVKRLEEELEEDEKERKRKEVERNELFRRFMLQKQQGVYEREEKQIDLERLENLLVGRNLLVGDGDGPLIAVSDDFGNVQKVKGEGSKRKRKGVKGTKKKRKRSRVKGVRGTEKKRKRRRVKDVRGTEKKRKRRRVKDVRGTKKKR